MFEAASRISHTLQNGEHVADRRRLVQQATNTRSGNSMKMDIEVSLD
jgi:hypothetical protein